MNANWLLYVIIAIVLIVLIYFLVKQNQKDKKELEKYLSENTTFIDKEEDEVNDN